MSSLVEALGGRIVGTVEDVSADRITMLLDPDAPHSTALNTGVPGGFPRINGYVLIPNESGATVCVISAIRIQRLQYPKRRGTQRDFGLVDLPFPSRLATLTPLGTLKGRSTKGDFELKVRRGVDVFPSVGDPVHLPDSSQLRATVEGESRATEARILLGHAPTAGGAPVHVDPDKLFGRHLAVLGNTGAGKSCTVAGLVRWSINAAKDVRAKHGRDGPPNARFIILDPNGEYAKAFADLNSRVFRVGSEGSERPLRVPAWLLNGEEWTAFADAAPGAQRPVLLKALRRLRGDGGMPDSLDSRIAATVKPYRNLFRVAHAGREHLRFPAMKNVVIALGSAGEELRQLHSQAVAQDHECVEPLRRAREACDTAEGAGRNGEHVNAIDTALIADVIDRLDEVASALGVPEGEDVDEDVPAPFDPNDLPLYVEALAGLMPGRDLVQFVETLNLRIRGMLARGRLKSVLQPVDGTAIKLEDWLSDHIGEDQAENGPIAVIDLSLVPSEVIHIIVSVLARMVFEAVQRYRRQEQEELPTTLVLEEAHTFVHRDLRGDSAPPSGRACARVFDRIAREGRKFGLGLVLASQRPSEISPTVLSQCNTFLLHRIVNDRDQELVRKLVPDGLGTLLRDLPSLPTRRAILLGWAAPAPVLVEVQEIPDDQRPHSPDPAFWDVWTGKEERRIDWGKIAAEWQRSDLDPGPTEVITQGETGLGAADDERLDTAGTDEISDDRGTDDDSPPF